MNNVYACVPFLSLILSLAVCCFLLNTFSRQSWWWLQNIHWIRKTMHRLFGNPPQFIGFSLIIHADTVAGKALEWWQILSNIIAKNVKRQRANEGMRAWASKKGGKWTRLLYWTNWFGMQRVEPTIHCKIHHFSICVQSHECVRSIKPSRSWLDGCDSSSVCNKNHQNVKRV